MDQHATIYLIDDDASVVRLVTRILADAGYRVISFSTAEAFLTQEHLSETGCVITDLYLPGIQGTEIQSHLQNINSHLTLIGISGSADVPTAVQLMRSGAITLLQKPFTPSDLLSAVEEGLSRNLRLIAQTQQSQGMQARLAALTDEELLVLRCLLKGMSRKAIFAALNLSPRTLDRRQQSLLQKMEANSVVEMVAACAANHVVAESQIS